MLSEELSFTVSWKLLQLFDCNIMSSLVNILAQTRTSAFFIPTCYRVQVSSFRLEAPKEDDFHVLEKPMQRPFYP